MRSAEGCHPFYLRQSSSIILPVLSLGHRSILFVSRRNRAPLYGLLCSHGAYSDIHVMKGWSYFTFCLGKTAYLSSDIVIASCLGGSILALFLPLIEQQLPTDSFHLWVALVCKLHISLTFHPPPAFFPFCTAVYYCGFWARENVCVKRVNW